MAIPTIRKMGETIVRDNQKAHLIRINPRDLASSLDKKEQERYIPLGGNTLELLQQIEKELTQL